MQNQPNNPTEQQVNEDKNSDQKQQQDQNNEQLKQLQNETSDIKQNDIQVVEEDEQDNEPSNQSTYSDKQYFEDEDKTDFSTQANTDQAHEDQYFPKQAYSTRKIPVQKIKKFEQALLEAFVKEFNVQFTTLREAYIHYKQNKLITQNNTKRKNTKLQMKQIAQYCDLDLITCYNLLKNIEKQLEKWDQSIKDNISQKITELLNQEPELTLVQLKQQILLEFKIKEQVSKNYREINLYINGQIQLLKQVKSPEIKTQNRLLNQKIMKQQNKLQKSCGITIQMIKSADETDNSDDDVLISHLTVNRNLQPIQLEFTQAVTQTGMDTPMCNKTYVKNFISFVANKVKQIQVGKSLIHEEIIVPVFDNQQAVLVSSSGKSQNVKINKCAGNNDDDNNQNQAKNQHDKVDSDIDQPSFLNVYSQEPAHNQTSNNEAERNQNQINATDLIFQHPPYFTQIQHEPYVNMNPNNRELHENEQLNKLLLLQIYNITDIDFNNIVDAIKYLLMNGKQISTSEQKFFKRVNGFFENKNRNPKYWQNKYQALCDQVQSSISQEQENINEQNTEEYVQTISQTYINQLTNVEQNQNNQPFEEKHVTNEEGQLIQQIKDYDYYLLEAITNFFKSLNDKEYPSDFNDLKVALTQHQKYSHLRGNINLNFELIKQKSNMPKEKQNSNLFVQAKGRHLSELDTEQRKQIRSRIQQLKNEGYSKQDSKIKIYEEFKVEEQYDLNRKEVDEIINNKFNKSTKQ
ncbi:Hypothetical_protein [Hexamita inflata]|uniref:Hypothetical_protein n=1 Tax=Hexamita inflata TaxID=28002 RepID=A0AA86NWM6_9EUKA|nr:Hypothetical protein HINF_LOCUS13676 [Hexamita inflata]CAI9962624.1 Hypothetical protein HINF_LOCUS50269 [Hexamita inflata]